MKIDYLFVCTGNTCRSVMAEKLFNDMKTKTSSKTMTAESAGTAAMPHYSIIGDLKLVMDENNIDYSDHIPKRTCRSMIETSGKVLTMTSEHKESLREEFPDLGEKIMMLSEYTGSNTGDIPDPIGCGIEAYRKAFIDIKEHVNKIIRKNENEIKRN